MTTFARNNHNDLFGSIRHEVAIKLLTILAGDDNDAVIKGITQMGLNPTYAQSLGSLTLEQFNTMTRNANQWLDVSIQVNPEKLERMLEHSKSDRKRRQTQDLLILAGASVPMMSALYGFTKREVTCRRKVLGVYIPNGRRNVLQLDEIAITDQWNDMSTDIPDDGERYLALSQKIGIDVDSIFRAVSR